MKNVKNLLEKAPYLCECKDPDKISLILTATYEATKEDGNAFDPTEEDFLNPENRLKYIDLRNDFWEAEKKEVAKKIMATLNICMISNWKRKGKITKKQYHNYLSKFRSDAIIPNNEVDKVMNIKEAKDSWWWS